MKKVFIILLLLFLGIAFFGFTNATKYEYFYGNGCNHCAKVKEFFKENNIKEKFDIEYKEVYFNKKNLNDFMQKADELGIDKNSLGVPFLYIDNKQICEYLVGDKDIVSYFEERLLQPCLHTGCSGDNCKYCEHENCPEKGIIGTGIVHIDGEKKDLNTWKFIGIMLPAALADSINPCAFAVMLLLLTSILAMSTSKRKALYAGLLFALSIFISYYAMGLGIFHVVSGASSGFWVKLVVGILGILIGLANLKDYFWYGKGFVMEVPLSRRPMLKEIINKITSPIGAFIIGFVVSLFLLPCTSGPYFTILGFLASESEVINTKGYFLLALYNIIFVLPMILIAVLVSLGLKSPDEIAKIKQKHTKTIHLIVGILMLVLGIYLLTTI